MRDSDIDTLSADGAQEAPPDLRALAAAATPGPEGWYTVEVLRDALGDDTLDAAAYIAAANPAAITALLDDYEREQVANLTLADQLMERGSRVAALEDGLRALVGWWDAPTKNRYDSDLGPLVSKARALLAAGSSGAAPSEPMTSAGEDKEEATRQAIRAALPAVSRLEDDWRDHSMEHVVGEDQP